MQLVIHINNNYRYIKYFFNHTQQIQKYTYIIYFYRRIYVRDSLTSFVLSKKKSLVNQINKKKEILPDSQSHITSI